MSSSAHRSAHRSPPRHHHHQKTDRLSELKGWNGEIYGKEVLGYGLSGTVYAIGPTKAYKIASGIEFHRNDVKIERKAYRRFEKARRKGNAFSRHVLRSHVLDYPDLSGIVLDRQSETLRRRLTSKVPVPITQVREWASQAAKGLAFIHSCGVVQGDVGCHNMLIDHDNQLRVSDFAGSSIDGSKATVTYEDWSCRAGLSNPSITTDLFALGSAIYEMSTGRPPWHGKDASVIKSKFGRGEYPSIDGLRLGSIIQKLWNEEYDNANQLVSDIMPDCYPTKALPQPRRSHSKVISKSPSSTSKIFFSSRSPSSGRLSSSSTSSLSSKNSSHSKQSHPHSHSRTPSSTHHSHHHHHRSPRESEDEVSLESSKERRKTGKKKRSTLTLSLLSLIHPRGGR